MGISDPEAALEKLREFRGLLVTDERALLASGPLSAQVARSELQPLIERIARELDTDGAEELGGRWNNLQQRWNLTGAIHATDRLIGILKRREDYQQLFGPVGPTLAASQLHPWVWAAAADLWDDGYHEQAVEEAFKRVERRTQRKVGRRDLSGKKLYANAFSLNDPTADMPRLRFPDIKQDEQPDDWTSAHEGAMHLGMGCAQGIRNRRAHASDDITAQEALAQLAALSVLARWVDECDAVSAADDAAGE